MRQEYLQRSDNRSQNEVRNLKLREIPNDKSVVSTYLEIGNSRVICSLYSGYSLEKRINLSEDCEIVVTIEDIQNDNIVNNASATNLFHVDTALFVKRTLESVICLDQHQKTYFEFVFEILEREDGILSHLLNLSCYTLLKANIMIKDVYSSSECVILDGNV